MVMTQRDGRVSSCLPFEQGKKGKGAELEELSHSEGDGGCQLPNTDHVHWLATHLSTSAEYFPTCTTPRELQAEKGLRLSLKIY